jgi:hypothetical protein
MANVDERAGLKEEISERPCGKREKADLDTPQLCLHG